MINYRSKSLSIVLIIISFFIGIVFVKADVTIQESNLKSNTKLCVNAPMLSPASIYLWQEPGAAYQNHAWPGVSMTLENNNYCYTVTEDNVYNSVIFNNNSNLQTIDLRTIGTSGNKINQFLYKITSYETTMDGKYQGDWYIMDTSAVSNLVSTAENIDSSAYTISSYNQVKNTLGNGTYTNQCSQDLKYISTLNNNNDTHNYLKINYSSGVYSSCYLTAYNALNNAMNSLVSRKEIILANSLSGSLSASYKQNSDHEISIQASPALGYDLSGLKVKKVTSRNGNDMNFGEITDIDVNPDVTSYDYAFDESEYNSNNMIGLYIEPSFTKKKYTISFDIGENGSIKDTNDNLLVSPIQVEYGDDYTLKIIGNEGFEIQSVLINDNEYDPVDNMVVLNDIIENKVVKVTFVLKTYDIIVDGVTYKLNYGTNYEDLVKVIAPDKEGYKFVKVVDLNNNEIDSSYIVKQNDSLKVIYEQIKNDDKLKNDEVLIHDQEETANSNSVKVENTGKKSMYYLCFVGIISLLIGIGILTYLYKIKESKDKRKL